MAQGKHKLWSRESRLKAQKLQPPEHAAFPAGRATAVVLLPPNGRTGAGRQVIAQFHLLKGSLMSQDPSGSPLLHPSATAIPSYLSLSVRPLQQPQ